MWIQQNTTPIPCPKAKQFSNGENLPPCDSVPLRVHQATL